MNAFDLVPHMGPKADAWWREGRALVALAVPLVLTEFAYMAIITTDVVMMGWLGPEPLAAGSLGGYYYAFAEFFAVGILAAVAPILAQHLGARRFRQVRPTIRQGVWLALFLSLACGLFIWHAGTILALLGQQPALAAEAQAYLRAMMAAFLSGLWLFLLSEFLAAHQRPRATLVVITVGIVLNGLANYVLMFGHLGLPRFGLIGAGIASSLVVTFMFLALLAFVLCDRRLRRYRLLGRLWRLDWARLAKIARLGIPIAVTELAEMSIFLVTALLIGLLGTGPLAANAIAMQSVALFFVVPMGMAQAATVRIGRARGAGDNTAAARAGWLAIGLGVSFALLPATLFWFGGRFVVGFYLDGAAPENQAVVELAVSLLAIAAVFQLVDASQIIARGALRGLKDTRGPMLIAIAVYWGLGVGTAALFGVYLELGGEAIWSALALSLAIVSVLLVGRFRRQSRRFAATDRRTQARGAHISFAPSSK